MVETPFAGTPHEMVTVYHRHGDDLLLTHYCAAGNQPRMKAEPSKSAAVIRFDFVSGTNMRSTDMPMHQAAFTFKGHDENLALWTSCDRGKPASQARFELRRE